MTLTLTMNLKKAFYDFVAVRFRTTIKHLSLSQRVHARNKSFLPDNAFSNTSVSLPNFVATGGTLFHKNYVYMYTRVLSVWTTDTIIAQLTWFPFRIKTDHIFNDLYFTLYGETPCCIMIPFEACTCRAYILCMIN